MKVVLQKRVPNLGIAGDIVTVKNGYARNYLIPNGFAIFADRTAMEQAAALKEKAQKEEQERVEALNKNLEALEGKTFTIERAADENGHLYGSVTAKDVLELLNTDEEVFGESDIAWEPQREVGDVPLAIAPAGAKEITVTIQISAE